MKKAWHVIDQSKHHYYLVDVLPHPSNTPKIPIEYQHQKYFVKPIELLPYTPQKGKNIYELQQSNVPQILDWLKKSFQGLGYWLKISPKVAIDFNNNTQVQRQQYINFLFGRFLVSDKRRQYLCIGNDHSTYHMNGRLVESIFKAMAGICNLWSYKVSLDDLGRIYGVFFKDVPIKFKIYVKEGSIIKLNIIPFKLVAKDLIGVNAGKSQYCEGVLMLNGRVFNAMANSSRQLKSYYRVPFKSAPSQAQCEDLEKITNYLMNIGITVNQVKAILQVYSLVMNINCIDFAKGRRDDYQFKLREGSHSKENITFLIGQQLTRLLEIQLNTFDRPSDYTKENVTLKQELLMRIIYWEITLKLAQIMNEKMCNVGVVFENFQEFIMVEFPPLSKYAQKSAEEQYINLFNQKINCMAFGEAFSKETYGFKFQTIHKSIKEEYACDINKEILKEMDQTVQWFDILKKGDFMIYLMRNIINPIGNSQARERQGKLDKLMEQLSGIEENDDYFVNYVIQTTVNQNNIPINGDITHKLLESVRKKTRVRKQLEPNALEENQENEQLVDEVVESQQFDEQDFIQIKLSIFQERYIYCKLLKELTNKDPKVPFIKKLQQYFQCNKDKGKVTKATDKVCLTTSNYLQLQRERKGHENCITKIKRQFKKAKFRHSLFANLELLYGKIKFNKTLCKKVYPIQRDAFKKIKRMYACSKMRDVLGNYSLRAQKIGLKGIKKRSATKKMIALLSEKVAMSEIFSTLMTSLRRILLRERCKRVTSKINNVIERKAYRLQGQAMKRLSQQYHIVVKPPPASQSSSKFKEKGPQPKKEEQRQSVPQSPNPSPIPENRTYQSFGIISQFTNSNNNKQDNKENIKSSEPIKQEPIKQEPSVNSYTSNSQSNYSSYGQSTNRGIERSQLSRKLAQAEIISIKDHPKFTFDIWCQEAIGFAKRKPYEPQSSPVVKEIFSKAGVGQQLIKQPPQELNVDLLIKQRVVVTPFFPYLLRHMDADDEQILQKIMSHQSSQLKKPLLKDYPEAKHLQTAVETFNCILKIGLDKNTSKSRSDLINMIIKPIRQTYHSQKSNISTVFQGEPAIVADYTWDHNLIKDEIFMQFIKQIMMNQKQESLYSLAGALEIITRYYYPSPKFIYGFLHFLKSLQSKNIEKLNECFVNTLLFAQVYEKYKGNNVTVLKDEVLPKQKESYPRLQPRLTNITEKELPQCLTIQFKLLNEQTFEFKVRNETLSHFKRKVLKRINMLSYEDYFGVYYCYQAQSPHSKMNQSKKAIDFLNEYPHSATDHLLYVKLKHYFPFSIKEVNKTRIMYLNSVMEERNLPWRGKDYESIVVLSMIFDEFEEYRISNYLVFTNQLQANVNLKPIQDKYTEMVNQRGKKISEIQYFKELKEHGFLGAKCYRMRDDNPQSALYKFTKILIKPLELCFYQQGQLMSSVSLRRIKGFGMEKGQIHIQLDFVEENHHAMRHLTLHHIQKMSQFYLDLSTYIGYLIDS